MLEWLSLAIPFLDPYPVWIKASVATWLVFSAILLVLLLFFRPAKTPGSSVSSPTGSTQQQATIKDSPNTTLYQAGRDLVIVPPTPTSPAAPAVNIQSITLEARLTCTTRAGVELPPEKVDLLAWFGGDATLRGPAGDATLRLVSPVFFQRPTDGRLVVINRFVLPEDSHLRFRPTQVLGTYNELLLPITTVVNTYSDAIDRIQLLELSLRINGGDPDYQSYRDDVEFVRGKGVTFTVPLRRAGG
jgi:hypothetical protein